MLGVSLVLLEMGNKKRIVVKWLNKLRAAELMQVCFLGHGAGKGLKK